MDLQLAGGKNDLEKHVPLDLQKKLAEVLKFKRKIQITNQEKMSWIFCSIGFTKKSF